MDTKFKAGDKVKYLVNDRCMLVIRTLTDTDVPLLLAKQNLLPGYIECHYLRNGVYVNGFFPPEMLEHSDCNVHDNIEHIKPDVDL